MDCLQSKVAELENGGMNRHQFEVTEHKVHAYIYLHRFFSMLSFSFLPKCACSSPSTSSASSSQVKEVEQKLELERSSARRYESQISRLRNQLERLREEKSDDVSHKSTESLTRAQKQIRELRGELQDAERKEQEIVKKKRIAVSGWGEGVSLFLIEMAAKQTIDVFLIFIGLGGTEDFNVSLLA